MCRSHELVRESEKHYKEIIQVLEVSKLRYYHLMSNLLHSSSDCVCVFQHIGIYDCCVCVSGGLQKDQRYLVLECVEEERARILEDFMHDLHRKGPPPPPTASNPSERLRK